MLAASDSGRRIGRVFQTMTGPPSYPNTNRRNRELLAADRLGSTMACQSWHGGERALLVALIVLRRLRQVATLCGYGAREASRRE